MKQNQYVFGYGWIASNHQTRLTRQPSAAGYICDLNGFKRTWGVAMDNSVDVPGYKYYVDDQNKRPDVNVAFLDIHPTQNSSVNGVCLPVDDAQLEKYDRIEHRQYHRVDVTDHLSNPLGKTWAYIGSPDGRARFELGVSEHKLCINKHYYDNILEYYSKLGQPEYDRCFASLDPKDIEMLELNLVRL